MHLTDGIAVRKPPPSPTHTQSYLCHAAPPRLDSADEECDTSSSAYDDNFTHIHHITDGADKVFVTSLTIDVSLPAALER